VVFRSVELHCKKSLAVLPSLDGMSLTKLCLASESDIPAGDGKTLTSFYSVITLKAQTLAKQREERLKEVKADSVVSVLATSGTVLTKTTSPCGLLKKLCIIRFKETASTRFKVSVTINLDFYS
jgi:hypothetical protein